MNQKFYCMQYNSVYIYTHKIYQKHLILRGKTEKSKIAVFFPTIYPFM